MKLTLAACASLVLLSPASVGAAPGTATGAAAKAKPACAITALPLMVGNEWTYTPVASPDKLTDAQQRLMPLQPKQVVVSVVSIEAAGPLTVVHLLEKADKRTVKSTITCGAGTFDPSPDSIFFTGEPGGYLGMTLDKVSHAKANASTAPAISGTGWLLAGGKFVADEWRDDITATWTQQATAGTSAKLKSGKIEIERRWVPQPDEAVSTPKGNFDKADKLMVEVTGRVFLDGAKPEDKPYPLAQGLISSMWFVDGVGVVQLANSFRQMYTLSDYKIAK